VNECPEYGNQVKSSLTVAHLDTQQESELRDEVALIKEIISITK